MGKMEGKGSVTVEGLSLVFSAREKVEALKNVSFEIMPEEFVCLLGPSGCGKSSVMNVIAGFLKPTTGSVKVDGRHVEAPGPDRGIVFQHYGLFPWKTVRNNIRFGLRMMGKPKEEIERIYNHYLDMVGLRGFENKYPFELSGGMQQRVGIARVLAIDPLLLLITLYLMPRNHRGLRRNFRSQSGYLTRKKVFQQWYRQSLLWRVPPG